MTTRASEPIWRRVVEVVVKRQAETGIDVPSDGEFGKRGWIQYVTERLNGLEFKPAQRPAYAKVIYADYKKFGGFYDRYKDLEESMWLPPSQAPLPPSPATPHAWVNTGQDNLQRARGHRSRHQQFQASSQEYLRGPTVHALRRSVERGDHPSRRLLQDAAKNTFLPSPKR